MPTFTVQNLIDRAATYADMTDGGNFVKPAEWIAWYNREARALDLFLLRNGYVYRAPRTQDHDAGTFTIEIPTANNPSAVIGVFEVRDGRFRRLRQKSATDFFMVDVNGTRPTGDAQTFTITGFDSVADDGLVIYLEPKPTSGTYRALYYTGENYKAAAVTDSFNWPLGLEERIVLGMARRALVKEESDTREIKELIAEEDQRIEELCWSRNMNDSPRIRNIDDVDRGWSNEIIFGPWDSWYWL